MTDDVIYDPETGLPIYGMDKEIRMKQASKYDPEMEKQARQWIGEVLGEEFPNGDFRKVLQNGVMLCNLVNKLSPGTVKKINKGKLAFMQMENINNFLEYAKKHVPKHDLFTTIDLYEGKNIPLVIQCFFSLASVVCNQKNYNGPVWGKKRSDKTEINFTEEQLRKSKSEVTQLSVSSKKYEPNIDRSRDVVKVNDTGDTSVVSQTSIGSIHKSNYTDSISREVVKVKDTPKPQVKKVVQKEVSSSSGGSLEDLEALAQLKDKGIITEEEFQQKKKQILGL